MVLGTRTVGSRCACGQLGSDSITPPVSTSPVPTRVSAAIGFLRAPVYEFGRDSQRLGFFLVPPVEGRATSAGVLQPALWVVHVRPLSCVALRSNIGNFFFSSFLWEIFCLFPNPFCSSSEGRDPFAVAQKDEEGPSFSVAQKDRVYTSPS